MNRTEQLFGITIKRLRAKGYEANCIMEEDGSESLVVNAHIDTVRCNVLLWAIDQQLENWRISHKLNDDGLTMIFKFNHDYPLNSFDMHRLHSTIVYATKCVPYAADEDNKSKKEEETNMISFNDIVSVLEEKGYTAFEESEDNAVYIIMKKDEPKKWYTTPECIGISTILDDESEYCKFVIRIKPGFDVNEKTMNLLMVFAKDMPTKNKSVNAENKEETEMEATTQEIINALRKKGYNAYAETNNINICNAGTVDKVLDWLRDTNMVLTEFTVMPEVISSSKFADLKLYYRCTNLAITNIEIMKFVKLMPNRDELVDDSASAIITITTIVRALNKKGYNAYLCDDGKSFDLSTTYMNPDDINKLLSSLPDGWVVDPALSLGSLLSITNHDATGGSLKDLAKWVESLPQAERYLSANDIKSNIARLGFSPYVSPFNGGMGYFDHPSTYPGLPMGTYSSPFNGGMGYFDHPSTYPGLPMGAYSSPFGNPSGLFGIGGSCAMPSDTVDSIIKNISDEDGNLNVDKAKSMYGSCKKTLKAIVHIYNHSNKSHCFEQSCNCAKGGNDMAQLGVITEQGDLGLGFDPLNEKDNKVVNESIRDSINKKENENNEE